MLDQTDKNIAVPPPLAIGRSGHDSRTAAILLSKISFGILVFLFLTVCAFFIQYILNSRLSQRYAIAFALAEEGISDIRAIRGKNFLKFFQKRVLCWNTKPDIFDLKTCDFEENKIAPGFYRIGKKVDEILLIPSVSTLNKDGLIPEYELTLTTEGDSSCIGSMILRPLSCYRTASTQSPSLTGKPSGFYRAVEIRYQGKDIMQVFSRIYFRAWRETKEIELTALLTPVPFDL